ncbi:MAG: 4Fe-4S dicluster domain-containing protein [Bacillota bacterium]
MHISAINGWQQLLDAETWRQVRSCYQCGRCTGGCPLAFAMAHTPRVLIRMLQLGLVAEALNSNTLWLCASCYSCSVTCPRGIDLTGLMYRLRQLAAARGVRNESVWFYCEFLADLSKRGIIHELGLMLAYARRVGPKSLLRHAGLGVHMISGRKLRLRPRCLLDREAFARVAGDILGGQGRCQ